MSSRTTKTRRAPRTTAAAGSGRVERTNSSRTRGRGRGRGKDAKRGRSKRGRKPRKSGGRPRSPSSGMSPAEVREAKLHENDDQLAELICSMGMENEELMKTCQIFMAGYEEVGLRIGSTDRTGMGNITREGWFGFWPQHFAKHVQPHLITQLTKKLFNVIAELNSVTDTLRVVQIMTFVRQAKRSRDALKGEAFAEYMKHARSTTRLNLPFGADEIAELMNEAQLEEKLQSANTQLEERENQISSLKQQKEDLKNSLNTQFERNLTDKIAEERAAAAKQWEEDEYMLKKKIERLEQTVQARDGEVENMASQVAERDARLGALEAAVAEANKPCAQCAMKEEEIERLRQLLADKSQVEESERRELEKLKVQLEQHKRAKADMQDEREEINRRTEKFKEKQAEFQEQINQLRQDNIQHERALADMETQRDALQIELENEQSKEQAGELEVEAAEAQNRVLKKKILMLERDAREALNRLHQVEAEKDAMDAQTSEQIEELQASNKKLKVQAFRFKKEATKVRQAFENEANREKSNMHVAEKHLLSELGSRIGDLKSLEEVYHSQNAGGVDGLTQDIYTRHQDVSRDFPSDHKEWQEFEENNQKWRAAIIPLSRPYFTLAALVGAFNTELAARKNDMNLLSNALQSGDVEDGFIAKFGDATNQRHERLAHNISALRAAKPDEDGQDRLETFLESIGFEGYADLLRDDCQVSTRKELVQIVPEELADIGEILDLSPEDIDRFVDAVSRAAEESPTEDPFDQLCDTIIDNTNAWKQSIQDSFEAVAQLQARGPRKKRSKPPRPQNLEEFLAQENLSEFHDALHNECAVINLEDMDELTEDELHELASDILEMRPSEEDRFVTGVMALREADDGNDGYDDYEDSAVAEANFENEHKRLVKQLGLFEKKLKRSDQTAEQALAELQQKVNKSFDEIEEYFTLLQNQSRDSHQRSNLEGAKIDSIQLVSDRLQPSRQKLQQILERNQRQKAAIHELGAEVHRLREEGHSTMNQDAIVELRGRIKELFREGIVDVVLETPDIGIVFEDQTKPRKKRAKPTDRSVEIVVSVPYMNGQPLPQRRGYEQDTYDYENEVPPIPGVTPEPSRTRSRGSYGSRGGPNEIVEQLAAPVYGSGQGNGYHPHPPQRSNSRSNYDTSEPFYAQRSPGPPGYSQHQQMEPEYRMESPDSYRPDVRMFPEFRFREFVAKNSKKEFLPSRCQFVRPNRVRIDGAGLFLCETPVYYDRAVYWEINILQSPTMFWIGFIPGELEDIVWSRGDFPPSAGWGLISEYGYWYEGKKYKGLGTGRQIRTGDCVRFHLDLNIGKIRGDIESGPDVRRVFSRTQMDFDVAHCAIMNFNGSGEYSITGRNHALNDWDDD